MHSASAPIAGADVLITSRGSHETWHVVSAATGDFAFSVVRSEGGYLLVASANGYRAKRVSVSTDSAGATVDVSMTQVPAVVFSAVKVRARRRPPPRRDDGMGTDNAENARQSPIRSALTGDVSDDLNALAGRIPGVSVSRDAAVTTQVSTTIFDPARGGFSGGQLSM